MALADACVSNDSGAMHVAAAVGVPLAAIFGPTNERETAPLPHADAIAQVIIHPVSCRPCMLRECPIDHPCMRDLAAVEGVCHCRGDADRDAVVDPRRPIGDRNLERPH